MGRYGVELKLNYVMSLVSRRVFFSDRQIVVEDFIKYIYYITVMSNVQYDKPSRMVTKGYSNLVSS